MGKVIPYTTEELNYLKDNYNRFSNSELTTELNRRFKNRRTPTAVKSKLNSLGLKNNIIKKWTPEEIEILNKYYGKITVSEIKVLLYNSSKHERKIANITQKAGLLGLTNKNYSNYWDAEEKETINNTIKELQEKREEQEHPQEQPKPLGDGNNLLRKYIKEKNIHKIINYCESIKGLPLYYICNEIGLKYSYVLQALYNNNLTIEETIKLIEYIQNYYVADKFKLDIKEIYKEDINSI